MVAPAGMGRGKIHRQRKDWRTARGLPGSVCSELGGPLCVPHKQTDVQWGIMAASAILSAELGMTCHFPGGLRNVWEPYRFSLSDETVATVKALICII